MTGPVTPRPRGSQPPPLPRGVHRKKTKPTQKQEVKVLSYLSGITIYALTAVGSPVFPCLRGIFAVPPAPRPRNLRAHLRQHTAASSPPIGSARSLSAADSQWRAARREGPPSVRRPAERRAGRVRAGGAAADGARLRRRRTALDGERRCGSGHEGEAEFLRPGV